MTQRVQLQQQLSRFFAVHVPSLLEGLRMETQDVVYAVFTHYRRLPVFFTFSFLRDLLSEFEERRKASAERQCQEQRGCGLLVRLATPHLSWLWKSRIDCGVRQLCSTISNILRQKH